MIDCNKVVELYRGFIEKNYDRFLDTIEEAIINAAGHGRTFVSIFVSMDDLIIDKKFVDLSTYFELLGYEVTTTVDVVIHKKPTKTDPRCTYISSPNLEHALDTYGRCKGILLDIRFNKEV